MTAVISRSLSFVGRHWLRLLIIAAAVVMLSRKQVNFNIRLGSPTAPTETPASLPGDPEILLPAAVSDRPVLTEVPPPAPLAAVEEKAGFLDRFNLFGGASEPSHYDVLTRQEEQVIAAFIRRFSNVAQTEQEKFGVPASITLANALLHGRAGLSPAAQMHHNFFNLPCGKDWPGATGRESGRCVRAYENAWTSFRDHSLFITSGNFSAMSQFSETDYRRWAAGLEELGFNKTDDLAKQLLQTIDRYQLFRFD
ncbi:glucosaminidase domain-containing protein [Neolewinella persica]|uniref:glucosaminidase domain-containing protein n=1 Tax=Neolewinella persica TaxID=70998 RepID=UPI00036BA771|nr:glucosaminidase domain-containing protein [Neolewinella persica]